MSRCEYTGLLKYEGHSHLHHGELASAVEAQDQSRCAASDEGVQKPLQFRQAVYPTFTMLALAGRLPLDRDATMQRHGLLC
jgi:hypothetical protein